MVYGGKSTIKNVFTSYGDFVDQLRQKMQHAHEIARSHLKASIERQKIVYDSKMHVYHFQAGDCVWLLNPMTTKGVSSKLQPSYVGPFLIIAKFNDLTYKLLLSDGTTRVVHHDKLKPYEGEETPHWIASFQSRKDY